MTAPVEQTRNEYEADTRGRLSIVPTTPPPADQVPAGWAKVDECLHVGHRFVLYMNLDHAGHRIDVDGIQIWETDDPDPDAAARELAARMSAAYVDDDQDQAHDDSHDLEEGDHPPVALGVAGEGAISVDRRPLLEDWQRSPAAAWAALRSLADDLAYRIAYRIAHPIRTVRALSGLWAMGIWWLVVRWARWTFDATEAAKAAETKALATGGQPGDRSADKTGLDWRADHRATVGRRLRGQAVALVPLMIGWAVGALRASGPDGLAWFWWVPNPTIAALLIVAAVGGPMRVGKAVRPVDAGPVLDTPITVRRVPDLRRNPGLILDGFEGLGGSRTVAAYRRQQEQGITACAWETEPMTTYADDGKTVVGLLAKVRTPEPARVMLKPNKEPEAVMAQAVGRSADQIKLHYDESDPANVVTVFVSERQLKDMTNIAWPYLDRRKRRANFFEPVPFGFDEYGHSVAVCLNGKHGLIGGATDAGKSSIARALVAAVMFDARVRLYAFFKMGADGHAFTPIAHRVRSGNDADDVAVLVADLQEIMAIAKRRGDFQEAHPELFPEGHVTEAAWQAVRSDPTLMAELGPEGLDPIVLYVDECRFMFLDPDVGPLLEWLCAQARAFAIHVLLATQYPDKKALPTSIKSNLLLRICLRVKTQADQAVVLGQGVMARAYVPQVLPERGMNYATAPEWAIRGAVRGRGFWAAIPDVHEAMQTEAERRATRGQLTGMASGQLPDDPSDETILDHVGSLGELPDRIHGQDLAVMLGERHAQYTGVDPGRILGMLRDHDVATPQIETEVIYGPDVGQRRNRNGVHRKDFADVYAAHLVARDAAEIARRALPSVADLPDIEPDNWADAAATMPDIDPDNGVDT